MINVDIMKHVSFQYTSLMLSSMFWAMDLNFLLIFGICEFNNHDFVRIMVCT